MIRGTKNEGISSQSKDRHLAAGAPNLTGGTIGEGIELIADAAGAVKEAKDADVRVVGDSTLNSGDFNGTFE